MVSNTITKLLSGELYSRSIQIGEEQHVLSWKRKTVTTNLHLRRTGNSTYVLRFATMDKERGSKETRLRIRRRGIRTSYYFPNTLSQIVVDYDESRNRAQTVNSIVFQALIPRIGSAYTTITDSLVSLANIPSSTSVGRVRAFATSHINYHGSIHLVHQGRGHAEEYTPIYIQPYLHLINRGDGQNRIIVTPQSFIGESIITGYQSVGKLALEILLGGLPAYFYPLIPTSSEDLMSFIVSETKRIYPEYFSILESKYPIDEKYATCR